MTKWPDSEFTELLGLEIPIVQAPMAGASGADMAAAVSQAGALGSLPGAMSSAARIEADVLSIRERTSGPINLNFFCHAPLEVKDDDARRWKSALDDYYRALGVAAPESQGEARMPFDESQCAIVEALKPHVVSFHFGLPSVDLLARVKSAGCLVMSSATTVAEARWLEEHGCDVVIAQGYEAGGHRGMFLGVDSYAQPGTLALVPQVVDAVSVPVLAAGGIADGRGIVAAFALGASGVQIGSAYLRCTQSLVSDLHRRALHNARDDSTALTNVFSGRPARGIVNRVMRELGPMSAEAPPFPHAGAALLPLKKAAEQQGSVDFSSLWSGQGVALAPSVADAGELTRDLAEDAIQRLRRLT